LHGYGSDARAFDAWRARLAAHGIDAFHVVQYRVDSNEVDLDDLAEALERTVRAHPKLDAARQLHVLVHSTGILVLLAWLARHPQRANALDWVIALAPASHGSPLARLGRGMLAALWNGTLTPGPDLLEGGDRLLRALELASPDVDPFQREPPPLDPARLLVASGTRAYTFPRSALHEEGTDGVVRLAGAHPLPIQLDADLTRTPRFTPRLLHHDPWAFSADALPLLPLPRHHHGTILTHPPRELGHVVANALNGRWTQARVARRVQRLATLAARSADARAIGWTQLVVRVEDERGEPVPDYYVDLLVRDEEARSPKRTEVTPWRSIAERHPDLPIRVHVYQGDRSRRCFHLDLSRLRRTKGRAPHLALRIAARTGSRLVGYRGHHDSLASRDPRDPDLWTATLDLTPALHATRALTPGTTTHLRIRLDREPLPFEGPTALARLP